MISSAVVVALTDTLPKHMRTSGTVRPSFLSYEIYMDDRFTNVDLFEMLQERSIGACGITRVNTKGFPAESKVRGVADKRMNWDSLGAVVVREVLCLVWVDNGAVQMLTTLNEVGDEHRVQKVRRCPPITSTNGARLNEIFGHKNTKKTPNRTSINDYTSNMGEVDIADQLHST